MKPSTHTLLPKYHRNPAVDDDPTIHIIQSRKMSVGLGISFVLWLTVVGAITVQMIHYSNSSGEHGIPVEAWPGQSQISLQTSQEYKVRHLS